MNNDTNEAKWREFNDEFGSLFSDSEIYVDSCPIPTHYRDTFFMVYLAAYKKREEEIARLREALEFYAEGYGTTTDDSFIVHVDNNIHMRQSSGKRARQTLKGKEE